MDNTKLNKGLILLGLLASLIFLLLSVLLNWIDDNAFANLESIIGYKWMMLILLIIISILFFLIAFLKIFSKSYAEQSTEKVCPRCKKPTLEVVNSTVRSLTYKCSNCGFEHKELKEGQTNTIRE